MPVELDTSELEAEFVALSRDEAREAAGRWFSTSQEVLYGGGDEHGYDVASVAQAARPPQWDESEGGYVFQYPHEASQYFEDGTVPHEVEGNPVLVFEWENAPQEVQDMFDETFPTVFLPKVNVDGIEALDYFKEGERAARNYLEGAR